jgi:uncharacterized pyridoxal phosphate-containing UPF0001 family protein
VGSTNSKAIGYANYIALNRTIIETFGDNQETIALAKNLYLTKRSKHIDISYHYIKDLQEQKKVNIKYILIDYIAADRFAKPLGKILFDKFKKQIDIVFFSTKK